MARPKKEAAVSRDLTYELNFATGKKIINDKALDTAYQTIYAAMTDKSAPAATNLNAAKSLFALAEQVRDNLAKNLTEGDYGNEAVKAAEKQATSGMSAPLIDMSWGENAETSKPN